MVTGTLERRVSGKVKVEGQRAPSPAHRRLVSRAPRSAARRTEMHHTEGGKRGRIEAAGQQWLHQRDLMGGGSRAALRLRSVAPSEARRRGAAAQRHSERLL